MRRRAALVVLMAALVACGGNGDPGESQALPTIEFDHADVGPSAVAANRAAGFSDDRTGAAAAATTYLASLIGLIEVNPADRRVAVSTMTAAGADEVLDAAEGAFELLDGMVADARSRDPEARVLLRSVPVAYDVTAFSPTNAQVEVWTLGLLVVEGETLATEVWSTNRVDLVWEADDWRLLSWSRESGPTPSIASTAPMAPTALLDAVDGWEGYGYVPAP